MINFADCANENKTKHNLKWLYIPDHPYRILIIINNNNAFALLILIILIKQMHY